VELPSGCMRVPKINELQGNVWNWSKNERTVSYWVREKIILGEVTTIIEKPISSESAPPVSATPKSSVKTGKKTKKTG
jgi:hypothetical protein